MLDRLTRLTAVAVVALTVSACAQTVPGDEFGHGASRTSPTSAIPDPNVSPTVDGQPQTATPVSQSGLDALVVADEHLDGSYDRALYPHWSTGPSGCSVRVEVLIRDSTTPAQVDMSGTCAVYPGGGDWYSPYDDRWFDDPAEIQIDHFVPLAEAHRSGAWAWDPARRTAFANDLTHPHALIAVSAESNQAKSDSDPADWMPANTAFRCEYAQRWVAVKVTWGLTVDPFERDTLATILSGCGDTTWVAVPVPSPAPPVAAPAPSSTPAASGDANAAAPCQPGQVKANRNSGIYHVPTGAHYAVTTANVECFDTEAAASAAGYRPVRG